MIGTYREKPSRTFRAMRLTPDTKEECQQWARREGYTAEWVGIHGDVLNIAKRAQHGSTLVRMGEWLLHNGHFWAHDDDFFQRNYEATDA